MNRLYLKYLKYILDLRYLGSWTQFWTLDLTLDQTLDLCPDWSPDRSLRISNLRYTGLEAL